ncbi:MAG: PLP-dependent aspartate aminotransferase family protein [Candidatus Kapaibacterium sp.]|nr:PLP-dependent aspartate aminotransferase family protein [Bacteroidota bacterium]
MQHTETRAVHASEIYDDQFGAVAPPIYLSTTFQRNPDGTFREHLYSRYSNPNRTALEHAVANLEQGECAFAFASGLAASMAIIQTLRSGDHILLPDDVYHGVVAQLNELFARFGITYSRVDFTNLELVKQAIRPNTKLVWTESPSNPMLKITDLQAVADIAHNAGALVVCDNTWATPILQRPLELGCDIVFHSATKYIGGHSDVLQGIVVLKKQNDLAEQFTRIQMVGGNVPSPFECWLATRGLKTMPVRVKAQSESAERVVEFLLHHPKVENVLYPGLENHPGHNIARKQMQHAGAMLSFLVKGNGNDAMNVANSTKLFTHATSLGAVESLIEHRASVEGAGSTTPQTLLRLSVGLEHPYDLIADLERALTDGFR